MFKMMASVHVPYRSAAVALTDLIGGQVQLMVISTAASIAYVKSGQLRALAVTTTTRWTALTDTPLLADFVPGYEASGWFGIGAPRNTPSDIIEKLNKEINVGLANPSVEARLVDLGGTVLGGTPADFGKLIAAETEKWAKVIKFANIKPE